MSKPIHSSSSTILAAPSTQTILRLALPASLLLLAIGIAGWLVSSSRAPVGWLQNPGPRAFATASLAGFSNGAVQVYFTRPGQSTLSRNRAGGLDETLAADIAHARKSIDLAFFDFDLPSVAAALIGARERGLSVRAVVDAENLARPGVARLTGEMQTAGIPITFDRRAAFMHD